MKNILGLDLGTNSIGWALIEASDDALQRIVAANSRIIPMDAGVLGNFDSGVTVSQTAERTSFRGIRRLRERNLLRRERLLRVLHRMSFLPAHYEDQIGWDRADNKTYGKFKPESEPKIAWKEVTPGKFEFIFQDSFNEMLQDFAQHQPALLANDRKVPYDWTLYYLRNKALTQKITKEELAWIILNFNQKRGYYQLRGEDVASDGKLEEYYALKVVSVEDSGDKKGKEIWYNVHLENGWIYRRSSSTYLDWVGKTKEFIVTTALDKDGNPQKDKSGEIKRSFRAPKEDDWALLKKKTESDIEHSGKSVGTYIYETLLQNPSQKIRGELVRTVERKFYKQELKSILEKQKEFHPELQDQQLYLDCINELYQQNESHKSTIKNRDFTYLILDDILFYQRPLKSKKSEISNCPFETRYYKENGQLKEQPVKCIAKSHPLFQEFRLWKFVANLRIYEKTKLVTENNIEKLQTDVDVTTQFLKSEDDYVTLFEWMNELKEIDQKAFLKYPAFKLKRDADKYRWNYVEDKKYPCNETHHLILSSLQKANIDSSFLNREIEEALWHILYSVEDKYEIQKALTSFAQKHNLPDSFTEVFSNIKSFKKEYGSYSAKAIRKLLSLMRMGKYWSENAIDSMTKERIDKIITGEYDEDIKLRVREKAVSLQNISQFRALPEWLASYIIYNRHSEAKDVQKWETPEDIDAFLHAFKQHSLRNPIVEQVVLETLRTVRDIWKQYGHIDEIHIELGREMKNPADKRERITRMMAENENANLRVKKMLMEFINPEFEIENVRPYSPAQQEILRIYEDTVLNDDIEIPDYVEDILKKFKESDVKKQPSRKEILKYKLWLEQKYRSPYTGEIIPLGKLFTPAYEIEHVIPQSRYFDDSLSNKVICESEVNKLKDNQLGFEFIKNHAGELVPLSFGKAVKLFTVDEYQKFIKDHYASNKGKMKKLLLEDIPDDFIQRQLNDSRYISKLVKGLLSNVVRTKDSNGEYEQEAVSKNLISCNGAITDRLKKDWGLNDIWNDIVSPRFERLNKMTETTHFGQWVDKGGKQVFQTSLPLENQKGFNKKRIDHRHHAMDAIVIACATRSHVNYLNNESAQSKNKATRYQLARKLRRFEDIVVEKNGEKVQKQVAKEFLKPWKSFTQDVYTSLSGSVVSFKQNLRVINRTTNLYTHFDEDGKKVLVKQTLGDSWAIRKPMHKDTVFGNVNLRKTKTVKLSVALENTASIVDRDLKNKLRELQSVGASEKDIKKYFEENSEVWSDINLSKIEVYYFTNDSNDPLVATRKSLDSSFTEKKIIESVTDSGIQKILLSHLANNGNDAAVAFSPDGVDEMNKNIKLLNNGKEHQPIRKVRVYEPMGNKFKVGETGCKLSKYVEAAKGTNLFFAIYQDAEGKRSYATVPLNEVINRQKAGLIPVPEQNEKGDSLLFWLSPNDLVYLPTEEELKNGICWSAIDKCRIYKIVSFTGARLYAIPYFIAATIINGFEYSQLNKVEFTDQKESIKELAIPLKVDRLGNIIAPQEDFINSKR